MIKTTTLAGLLAVAAAPALAQETPKQGGTLAIQLNADIRSLEPGINRDANSDTVVQMIFEGLVGYKTDLTVGPALADSWTVSDEGKTYTFKLRPEARFHNGAPVTSTEVKWAWERQMSQAGWACKRFFDGTAAMAVTAVETPDPQTIVYKLDAPSSLFLKQLANFQCGAMVFHPDSVDGEGKWKTPVATGPLKIKEWKRGEYVTLDRFQAYVPSKMPGSGYSGARVMYLDEVQLRIIPDPSAANAALVSGAIDVVPNIEVQDQAALKSRGMTIMSSPGLSWTAMLLQIKDPVLANPKVRQAIAHAIDRKQIAQARGGELIKANSSTVSDASAFYDPRFLDWPAYDPKRAAQLLKEGGYTGQPVKIQANKRYVGMYENAVVVQAMLVAIGMKAEIEVLDWATQLDNYSKGKFQLQSFSYSARFDPGLLLSGLIADKAKFPWAQWDDAKAIELLGESGRSTDDTKRKEIFLTLHRMMAEQVPVMGLYFDVTLEALSPKVKGYVSWPANKPLPWGVWKAG